MTSRFGWSWRFCWLALLLLVVGCGKGNYAYVTGRAMVDGTPLPHGTIIFHPVSGVGTSPSGKVRDAGTYQLYTGSKKGLVPGEYIATVNGYEVLPPKTEYGLTIPKRLTHKRYASVKTSELRFTIEAGKQTLDIDVKAK